RPCAPPAARADRRPLRRARAGARAQGVRRAALSSRAARQHVPERGGLSGCQVIALDPFEHPEAPGVASVGGRQGRTFAAERQTEGVTVFDAVVAHAKRLRGESKRVIVACWSNGARERLATLLSEHGIGETKRVESFADILREPRDVTAMAVLPL